MALKTERPTLPPEDSPEYLEAVVTACIKIFEKVQDNKLTLDFMGVKGKMRPLVMKHERYQQETRMMKAELVIEEIDWVENAIAELNKEEVQATKAFDIRNITSKEAASFAKDSKDRFAQMLKLKDRRAELRSMTREEEAEEIDALNIVFIALTAEEFAKMGNVEINEGSDEGVIEDAEKQKELVAARDEVATAEDRIPFRLDADGNLVSV